MQNTWLENRIIKKLAKFLLPAVTSEDAGKTAVVDSYGAWSVGESNNSLIIDPQIIEGPVYTETLNKTYKEIKQAFMTNKNVVIRYTNAEYQSEIILNIIVRLEETPNNYMVTIWGTIPESPYINETTYTCTSENDYPEFTDE